MGSPDDSCTDLASTAADGALASRSRLGDDVEGRRQVSAEEGCEFVELVRRRLEFDRYHQAKVANPVFRGLDVTDMMACMREWNISLRNRLAKPKEQPIAAIANGKSLFQKLNVERLSPKNSSDVGLAHG